MERLLKKIETLKTALEESDCLKEYKKAKEEVMSDNELLTLIEKYNITKDERYKEKILNNKLYEKYKHQEAELNILILEINSKLKRITKKGKL